MIPVHSGGPSSSEKSWIVRVGWTFEKTSQPQETGQLEACWGVVSGRGFLAYSLVVVTLLGDRGHFTKQFDLLLHATLPAPKSQ